MAPTHSRSIEHCAREVVETVPLVIRFMRSNLRRAGLPISLPQLRVLALLDQSPGTSVSEAGEHVGVTRATASALVDRLVRRGLVNRADDPKERRKSVLTLTEPGRHELDQARRLAQEHVAALLSGLAPAELAQIADGLLLLKDAFREAAGRNGR